jgi:demethylmenaquinone methyltransferase/2-methoxy-6-polyprenyl-1,4-benzoquinol methylase
MRVAERIATPAGKKRYVRTLFATIAERYDFITVVLSYGQDRRWKRRLIALASPSPGEHALDLATGTGDIAFALAARGARVVGLDVTQRMIELARGKASAAARSARHAVAPTFFVGDMVTLPFRDRSFDLVTIGYGLRNVPDLPAAVAEIHRVLKPGGRVLSLDFNRPANSFIRAVYLRYLSVVGGLLGWALHRDPDTYRYIPASIRSYPGAGGVARLMAATGFTNVTWHRVLGGLMAIHQASAAAVLAPAAER